MVKNILIKKNKNGNRDKYDSKINKIQKFKRILEIY